MSTLTSQWIIVELKSWDSSKIAAAMHLSTLLFLGGLIINLYTWISATDVENEQDIYVKVFFGFVCSVLLRRIGWCMYIQKKLKCFSELNLTKGHGKMTTDNLFSGVVLYPAVFITYHHLLWILLGIITEPFWGFTVLEAVISLCATFFYFFSELYSVFPKKFYSSGKCSEIFIFFMSFLLIVAVLHAFVLFMLVLFAVAQASMGESLISTLIQNILTFVVTAWLGYMNILTKLNPGNKREGGDECDGNGAEGTGGEDNKGSANGKTKRRKKGMKKEEEVLLQVHSQKLPEMA